MKTSKPVITVSIILSTLAIVIILAALFIENYIENELQNRQVGSYIIHSGGTNVNLLLRQVKIKNAIAEDSVTHQKSSISEIKATGIHIFPYIFNNNIIINSLLIKNSRISLIQNESNEKKLNKADNKKEGDIKQIRINKLKVLDAVLALKKQTSDKSDTIFSFKAEFNLWNLTNSNTETLNFENYSAEKFQLQLNNGKYNLPGKLYRLQFDKLTFNSEQEVLRLENLYFSSIYQKYEIAKQTGVETDWYNFSLQLFEIKRIDMNALLQDTAVVFQKALLENLDAVVFRDKRPPFPEKPDSKLPMEMLNNLPFDFHSDSIEIKNSNIIYEEHAEKSIEPGTVSFNQLYATIYNLSTMGDLIGGPTAMSARAMVMNESLLKAEFIFPNKIYSNKYKVSGSLKPINIAKFNPMIVPTAFVRVNEGQIKRMEFDFTYNNNKSEGNLVLEYENLDISLLDKEDGSQKKIKTFITETFILQNDNLKQENSYQKGSISFERDKKKSIFNYWWKSLFSGIKDILAF